MSKHKPADPRWWTRIKSGRHEGDYEQQGGRYRLAAMTDSGGRTNAWVLYIDGVMHEQRRTLRDAKSYAYMVTSREALS